MFCHRGICIVDHNFSFETNVYYVQCTWASTIVYMNLYCKVDVCQIGEYAGIVVYFVASCGGVYLNITSQMHGVMHQFKNA